MRGVVERIELYTAFEEEPTEAVRTTFRELVGRRARGALVAYLVGRREFFSLNFESDPRRTHSPARDGNTRGAGH